MREVQLAAILQRADTSAGALIAAMQNEREALERQDADAMNRVIKEKQQLFGELDRCWGDLKSVLYQSGLTCDKHGLVELAERYSQNIRLQAVNLIHRLEHCESLNKINGSIIHLSMRRVNLALNVLFSTQRQTHTYDALGNSVTRTSPTTVLKA